MNLERKIAGIKFSHPIMNGPGWACKTMKDVEVLARSMSSGILIGAVTKEARYGNPGDTSYFDIPYLSVNSLGMPNPGMEIYKDTLPFMVEIARSAKKPIGVNVAGFNEEEFLDLAELARESGVDWIEINLSCPNIHDTDKKSRIICYDFELTRRIILGVVAIADMIPVSAKLSPFSDPVERKEAAYLMQETKPHMVTLCNTFPDALVYEPGIIPSKPAIYSKLQNKTVTMGGLGGPALKPIALAHVKLFREILHPWQGIIGIGGIQSGQDVIEYEEAGANIVQLTTAHAVRQSKVFEQILTEYISIKSKFDKPQL